MAIEIREINWTTRRVVTSDERSRPIVDLFDILGRPIAGPSGAVLAVAGEPGDWVTFKLGEFDRRKLQ